MTDLEITKLCAMAMGLSVYWAERLPITAPQGCPYDPLHDDAQAMALAKRFPHYALAAFSEMCGDIIDRGAMTGCRFDVVHRICYLVACWQKLSLPSAAPVCSSSTTARGK